MLKVFIHEVNIAKSGKTCLICLVITPITRDAERVNVMTFLMQVQSVAICDNMSQPKCCG